jgi:AraC-like DNA-binding protein
MTAELAEQTAAGPVAGPVAEAVELPHNRLSRLSFMNTERTRTPVRRRLRSRGVPNALADHLVAESNDPRRAAEFVSDLLGPATLAVDPAVRSGFHGLLHAIQTLDVAMAHLNFQVPCLLDVPRSAGAYTVHMTTSGDATACFGDCEQPLTPFTGLVVSPGMRYQLKLGLDSPQLIIRIEQAAMERQLSRMLGRSLSEPIVFEPIADLTTAAAVRWHGAIQILSSEVLSDGSLLRQGIGAEALGELLVSSLLFIQDHTYSGQLHHRGPSGRAVVRRCMAYIDEHLAERITLDDLAEHCGMSVRSIQSGFRQDLSTTPVAYIRDQRLLKVRAELMSAAPGDHLTVTDAAQRWGFTHLGNFSVLYRQRFGESPSRTLRR